MSKFNEYARKIDRMAKESFKKYREAEEAYKAARDKMESYPKNRDGVLLPYVAQYARAQADFYEAQEVFRKEQKLLAEHSKEMSKIREELETDLEDHYAPDPKSLDSNTLELLKSGALKSGDYERLLEEAKDTENYTMIRLIGRYAKEAADEESRHNGNSPKSQELRAVSNMANQVGIDDHMSVFDSLVDVYNRSVKNPGMIDFWESLTSEIVENF